MKKRESFVLPVALVVIVVVVAVALLRPKDVPDATAPEVTAEVTAEVTTEVTQETADESTATPAPTIVPTATPQLKIDPYAGDLVTPTPEPGVAIPGWGSMTLPAGVTEAQTAMQNPAENEGLYYLTFELRLPAVDEATGEEGYEVIFTTGLIPPGQYCNKVNLNRALEPGEYPAVVHVQPYRISDQSPTNNADMETVLIVK